MDMALFMLQTKVYIEKECVNKEIKNVRLTSPEPIKNKMKKDSIL